MMKLATLFATLLITATLHAGSVPLELARPDDQPGNPDKPVQVYILAGQSNMVGMGDIKGARPPYPSVYLSADPAVITDMMHIGTDRKREACTWYWQGRPALRAFGVYQEAEGASAGARVNIYQGSYDPNANYAELKPEKTTTVPLGVFRAEIPTITGDCTPIAKAYIEVPTTGTYLVHVGFGPSSHAIATLGGQEVYKKEVGGQASRAKIELKADKRYPLEIAYFEPGSAMLWLEQVDLVGVGDLVTLTGKDGKFPYLIDDAGEWTVRQDVYFEEARIGKKQGSLLSATSNGGSLGPEVGFGFVMGTYHDEQVLLIKTAMGNRSLKSDFRPPSSGRENPDSQWEGLEYRLMVEGVKETLKNIAEVVPGYDGQGYNIAGFVWFQGHKDSGSTKQEYEGHLVNLIKDLRKDLSAPNMKAVVATVGFHGYRIMSGNWKGVWEAQMAVGDPQQHPEFEGNVASVDTRDFWREIEESPRNQDYHYHRNPEFYLLTGEATGRAMVRLLGGEAQTMPKSNREAKTLAAMKAEAARPIPSQADIAASMAATKPMILDGVMQAYLNNPRNQKALVADLVTAKPMPDKSPDYLEDSVDDVVAFLHEAGIEEYDWKPVLPDMPTAQWEVFSFDLEKNPYDLPEPKRGEKPELVTVELDLPAGQDHWYATDFDAAEAGWRKAQAPFGKTTKKTWPEDIAWVTTRYPEMYLAERPQPATVIEDDVLLMRGTFNLPPAKPGHRYRIRIAGSNNTNSGEAYAIYVNGKLIGEQKEGVTAWRRQGLRGSHVWQEFTDDFKGGNVTIAVANFPMSNWRPGGFIPTIGPLSVWIEEQKLPNLDTFAESLISDTSM